MGGVFHISEEEAARDFGALLARVRASEFVVVDCADGTEAVIHSRRPAVEPAGRTIAEALAILRVRRETHGLATPDGEFAADMEAVHAIYNQPMDSSQWD